MGMHNHVEQKLYINSPWLTLHAAVATDHTFTLLVPNRLSSLAISALLPFDEPPEGP